MLTLDLTELISLNYHALWIHQNPGLIGYSNRASIFIHGYVYISSAHTHHTLLSKHNFKDKIIKNLQMMTSDPYTKHRKPINPWGSVQLQ